MKKIILSYVNIVTINPGAFALKRFSCIADFMQCLLYAYDFMRFIHLEEKTRCPFPNCTASPPDPKVTSIKEMNLALDNDHISSLEDAYNHAIQDEEVKMNCFAPGCAGSQFGDGDGTSRVYSSKYLLGPIACIQLKVRMHDEDLPAIDTSRMEIKDTMMFNDEPYK